MIDLLLCLCVGWVMVMLVFEMVDFVLICWLVDVGVIVSVGYIDVDYDMMVEVIDVGLIGVIYLFNVMLLLLYCVFGVVGVVFDDCVVYCGLIVDGLYVYDVVLWLVVNVCFYDWLMLVSDVMLLVGVVDKDFLL